MNEQDVLLDTLRRKKISIRIDKDGLLDIEAPSGTLTEEIITQIREKREVLLNYLKGLSGQGSHAHIPLAPLAASYPLSSSQRRLWVLNQINQYSTAYNIPCSVMLDGNFSSEQLSRAITAVVNRHEILRTVFREDASGVVRQWVLPETSLNVEVAFTDLSLVPDQDAQAGIKMEEDKKTLFDLSKGPLFRVALFRMATDKHLLYFNMHHIISDGWSINVLAEEVLNYYNAYGEGRIPDLKPLTIQYKDYAVWQQEQLATAAFEQHRLYWMKQFAGPLPLLNLPADRVRPAVFAHHGSAVATIISNELLTALQELCQQHGATLFMGLLAITNALFYRYTGQQDIITGSPVAGREQVELANQIGMYVNTLPFRIHVNADESFSALLKEVRNITSAAYEHQEYPFDKIVEDLALKRDMSRSPLFDVMISLHNLQDKRLVENVHAIPENEIVTLGKEVVKFDMSIDFLEMAEGLYMKVAYNEDIYQQSMVHQLICHFKGMLSYVVQHPETPVNQILYLSERDKGRLLLTFNDTATTYPRDVTITGLFARQVALHPGNTAVVFENETITYEELQENVHSLAAMLIAYDVKPGDFIPLLMSRGIDYVVAFMALLQLGAICTPVSINWPEERVETLLMELHPKVVLANEEGINRCGIKRPAQLLVISHHQLKPVKTFFESRENPEGPVCMFYTSGTTGLPKGVVVMHRGIMNRFLWMNDYFGVAAAQSVLRTTRHIFDSALWQLFWPLINGGRTIIPSEHRPLDLEYFAELIRDYQVTMTDFVPSLFNEVVNEIRQQQDDYHFDSLKDIVIGGEAIHVLSANIFRQHYPHIRLTNLYGPTEASIGCIYYELKKDHYDKIPIGKPIHNVRIYLVDEKGELVPEGIGGEICIAGVCLAAGYYRDENRTNEKFIENPYATAGYGRMYRTGDIGRWLPDGNIEYLGRIDEQVKIRGYRIEPGEIEHALTTLPGITAAAVIPWKTAAEQTHLVGYVTAGYAIHKQTLKQELRKQLPEYMVPVHFVQLDHLPLLPNGKINKKVLPVQSVTDLETGVEHIAPRNPVEEALVDAYKEVTRQSAVSIKDSFFDLGGDSIKAILLASQLRQRGYAVKVGDVLMYPVLEELATQVQLQHNPLPEQAAVEGRVVLTPIQRWFMDRNYAHKHHYNQSVLLSSRVAVNRAHLE
ncbi:MULTISPECIES: non-ribosomal peptide synthetase, partial [unclassified Chitinophaga]|uniref:non-ribosomal peptide synthetase n=1 Tax=unclassified Chitinophaga TaxID=2619133 RepID=UPI00300F8936